MAHSKRYSISRSLTLSLIIAVAVVSTAASGVYYYVNMMQAREQLNNKADEYVNLIADALRMPLWSLHSDSIESVGASYAQNEFIAGITILDSQKEPLFVQEVDEAKAPFFYRSMDVYHNGEFLGRVEITFTEALYLKNLKQLLMASVTAAIAILTTLTALTGTLLRRFLAAPLHRLGNQVNDYATGVSPLPPGDTQPVEFEDFITVLTSMGRTIEQHMETLREAEARYRSLVETLNDCVWETDAQGVYTYISPRCNDLLGREATDMIGRSRFDFMPDTVVGAARDAFRRLVAEAAPFSGVETVLLDVQGGSVLIECNGAPIAAADGSVVGVRGVDRDISERKAREEAERDREAAEAAAAARSVFLDNSGQGFLSFGNDLIVEQEYSRECLNIFGREIGGRSITTLIYSEDTAAGEILAKNIQRILHAEDSFKQDLLLSLLKKEYRVGATFVEAEYRVVDGKIMLVLTDITRRKELEYEVAQERNRLKFVVSTVRETRLFFAILDDFDSFRNNELPRLLQQERLPDDSLNDVYRQVHTFKGLFAQQDFLYMPQALHEIESGIARLQKRQAFAIEELEHVLHELVQAPALRQDLDVIKEFLGDSFMRQRDTVVISRDQVLRLEAMADRLLNMDRTLIDKESVRLLNQVKHIRHVNLKSLLSNYPKGALELAERLGKRLRPFAVTGEDIFVNPDVYSPFTMSLVHVFRNGVAHGIEDPEERIGQGKGEAGHMRCEIKLVGGKIRITIADDGRGIDAELIRRLAVEKGMLPLEQAGAMTDGDVQRLVFEMDFSSRNAVSGVCGRGVGLAAVMHELVALGGEVEVESARGVGTTMRFLLPFVTHVDENAKAPASCERG